MATPKRAGGRQADVVAGDTAAGRRAAKRALGPQTGDDERDRAYNQGRGAAKRAIDERPRGRRARGPAQVHSDPELQGYYEQGHHDHVREARRDAVAQRVGPPATKAFGSAKSAGGNGAGFILGLVAYALVRNFLTGGWAGDRAWLAAKFLNKVESPVVTKPTKPTKPSTGSKPTSPTGAGLVGPGTPFSGWDSILPIPGVSP